MAEITKVTTPLIPRENLGNRNKPVSDQAFELTDPNKVHKAGLDSSKILDQQRDSGAALRDGMGKAMMAPLMKPATEMVHAFQKITMLLQMGISTSEIATNAEIRDLLNSLYLSPDQLGQALKEQDASAVLFKGSAFDVLRDIMAKFEDNPKVKQAISQLLKVFEQNVNTGNSVKTILLTCANLLDYMFSKDKAQFEEYLSGLKEMLLSGGENEALPGQTAVEEGGETAGKTPVAAGGDKAVQSAADKAAAGQAPVADGVEEGAAPGKAAAQAGQEKTASVLELNQKEAAQILKGNLLPLLGEIVVKYNQNDKIRDMVMVVVHNIVRVDQGSDEALREAVAKLVNELRQVANLPESFQKNLTDALARSTDQVKQVNNETMEKLSALIHQTLSSPTANAATVRQVENLLMSMLQNQSSVMNLLHFVLPMETQSGKLFAEMYVDPDSDEKVGRSQERSRKIFLAFESDSLGGFELAFVEAGQRVDFAMWCPEALVSSLSGIKRQIEDLMQIHGYTMNSYQVAELREQQSVAQVFPKLLNRRIGVDVRI